MRLAAEIGIESHSMIQPHMLVLVASCRKDYKLSSRRFQRDIRFMSITNESKIVVVSQ